MVGKNAYQVIIVGGGIAGASLAYFLAERGLTDVLLLEKEEQPGYHSTGRSAAVLVEIDPVLTVLQLKIHSAGFFREPPTGFSENPVLVPSGILALFAEPLWSAVLEFLPFLDSSGVAHEILSPDEIISRVPVLSPGYFEGGVLLAEDGHLDVHELLWSYLRHAKQRGVEVRCGLEVKGIDVDKGRCRGVVTDVGTFQARWIVNAAGAWAGRLGTLTGATPIELTPKRRTIVSFTPPEPVNAESWPFVANESHCLYFGPESHGFIASPMDEDPHEPCDARPEEIVVAETLHRMEMLAPGLVPRSLRRTWAGLRTFAPDRVPVVGEDPRIRGFFWLAGQGGAGIETSPAVGQIAADLILDGRTERFDEKILSPMRFRNG